MTQLSFLPVQRPYWSALHKGCYWSALLVRLLSILGCSPYWSALHTALPSLLVCSRYWTALHTGLLSVLGCPPYWSALGTGLPSLLVCSPYCFALPIGLLSVLDCPPYWPALGTGPPSLVHPPRQQSSLLRRPLSTVDAPSRMNVFTFLHARGSARGFSLFHNTYLLTP
jgi:hypothetical protein